MTIQSVKPHPSGNRRRLRRISVRRGHPRRGATARPHPSATGRSADGLAWYQPGIFTAVMDYMDFSDALAADADTSSPDRGLAPTGNRPRSAADAAPTSASSSSSAWTTGTTAGAPSSARQRSSTPDTPPSWPGALQLNSGLGSDLRSREPNSAPSAPWRGARGAPGPMVERNCAMRRCTIAPGWAATLVVGSSDWEILEFYARDGLVGQHPPLRAGSCCVIETSGGNPGLQSGDEAGAPRSGAVILP